MIENNSFKLYDKLVKEDNYKYIFDIKIIYQVNETLQYLQLIIDDEGNDNFKKVCNEVKRQYLKYDEELNDSLVETVLNEMGFTNGNDDVKRLNACYKGVQELRKNIDMKKYNSSKALNKNDKLYSWMFDNDAVLKETKKELLEQFNNINYIHDIFYSYKEILYNCQKDI